MTKFATTRANCDAKNLWQFCEKMLNYTKKIMIWGFSLLHPVQTENTERPDHPHSLQTAQWSMHHHCLCREYQQHVDDEPPTHSPMHAKTTTQSWPKFSPPSAQTVLSIFLVPLPWDLLNLHFPRIFSVQILNRVTVFSALLLSFFFSWSQRTRSTDWMSYTDRVLSSWTCILKYDWLATTIAEIGPKLDTYTNTPTVITWTLNFHWLPTSTPGIGPKWLGGTRVHCLVRPTHAMPCNAQKSYVKTALPQIC